MQKWEYLFVYFGLEGLNGWGLVDSSDLSLTNNLSEEIGNGMYSISNGLGEQGWELITQNFMNQQENYTLMIFKRSKP